MFFSEEPTRHNKIELNQSIYYDELNVKFISPLAFERIIILFQDAKASGIYHSAVLKEKGFP